MRLRTGLLLTPRPRQAVERVPDTLDEELQVMADLQALDPGQTVDVAVLNRADPLLLKQVTEARVARAAGLRNRLVHDYDDLDQRLLFAALEEALDDVPAYVAAVRAALA